jgi:hypothetical protein
VKECVLLVLLIRRRAAGGYDVVEENLKGMEFLEGCVVSSSSTTSCCFYLQ